MKDSPDSTKLISEESSDFTILDLVSSVKEHLQLLKSKVFIIVLLSTIAFILGFLYSLKFRDVKYKAELTFALEEGQSSAGGLSGALGLASSFGVDLGTSGGGGAFASSNLLELMRSKYIITNALVRRIPQANDETFADYFIKNLLSEKTANFCKEKKISYVGYIIGSNRQSDSLLGLVQTQILNAYLSVDQVDKKVFIYKITCTSKVDWFSQHFVEALVDQVSSFYIKTKSARAKYNVDILIKQVDSVKTELNKAISGAAIANDQTFNLNSAMNINRTPLAKRQIDVQANTAILTELVKNLEIAKVALRKETPLIQIIDRPILPLERIGQEKILTGIKWAITTGLIVVFFVIVSYQYNKMKNSLLNSYATK